MEKWKLMGNRLLVIKISSQRDREVGIDEEIRSW